MAGNEAQARVWHETKDKCPVCGSTVVESTEFWSGQQARPERVCMKDGCGWKEEGLWATSETS